MDELQNTVYKISSTTKFDLFVELIDEYLKMLQKEVRVLKTNYKKAARLYSHLGVSIWVITTRFHFFKRQIKILPSFIMNLMTEFTSLHLNLLLITGFTDRDYVNRFRHLLLVVLNGKYEFAIVTFFKTAKLSEISNSLVISALLKKINAFFMKNDRDLRGKHYFWLILRYLFLKLCKERYKFENRDTKVLKEDLKNYFQQNEALRPIEELCDNQNKDMSALFMQITRNSGLWIDNCLLTDVRPYELEGQKRSDIVFNIDIEMETLFVDTICHDINVLEYKEIDLTFDEPQSEIVFELKKPLEPEPIVTERGPEPENLNNQTEQSTQQHLPAAALALELIRNSVGVTAVAAAAAAAAAAAGPTSNTTSADQLNQLLLANLGRQQQPQQQPSYDQLDAILNDLGISRDQFRNGGAVADYGATLAEIATSIGIPNGDFGVAIDHHEIHNCCEMLNRAQQQQQQQRQQPPAQTINEGDFFYRELFLDDCCGSNADGVASLEPDMSVLGLVFETAKLMPHDCTTDAASIAGSTNGSSYLSGELDFCTEIGDLTDDNNSIIVNGFNFDESAKETNDSSGTKCAIGDNDVDGVANAANNDNDDDVSSVIIPKSSETKTKFFSKNLDFPMCQPNFYAFRNSKLQMNDWRFDLRFLNATSRVENSDQILYKNSVYAIDVRAVPEPHQLQFKRSDFLFNQSLIVKKYKTAATEAARATEIAASRPKRKRTQRLKGITTPVCDADFDACITAVEQLSIANCYDNNDSDNGCGNDADFNDSPAGWKLFIETIGDRNPKPVTVMSTAPETSGGHDTDTDNNDPYRQYKHKKFTRFGLTQEQRDSERNREQKPQQSTQMPELVPPHFESQAARDLYSSWVSRTKHEPVPQSLIGFVFNMNPKSSTTRPTHETDAAATSTGPTACSSSSSSSGVYSAASSSGKTVTSPSTTNRKRGGGGSGVVPKEIPVDSQEYRDILRKRYGRPMPLSVKMRRVADMRAKTQPKKPDVQSVLFAALLKRMTPQQLERRPRTRLMSAFMATTTMMERNRNGTGQMKLGRRRLDVIVEDVSNRSATVSPLPVGEQDVVVVEEDKVVSSGNVQTVNGVNGDIEFVVGGNDDDDNDDNDNNDISKFITPDLKSQGLTVAPEQLNVQKLSRKRKQPDRYDDKDEYLNRVREAVDGSDCSENGLLANGFETRPSLQPKPSINNNNSRDLSRFSDADVPSSKRVCRSLNFGLVDKSNDLIADNYQTVIEVIEDEQFAVDNDDDNLPLSELQRQLYLKKYDALNRTAIVFSLPPPSSTSTPLQPNVRNQYPQKTAASIPNGYRNSQTTTATATTASNRTRNRNYSRRPEPIKHGCLPAPTKITSRRNATTTTSSSIKPMLPFDYAAMTATLTPMSTLKPHPISERKKVQTIADNYYKLRAVTTNNFSGIGTPRRLNTGLDTSSDTDDFATLTPCKMSAVPSTDL